VAPQPTPTQQSLVIWSETYMQAAAPITFAVWCGDWQVQEHHGIIEIEGGPLNCFLLGREHSAMCPVIQIRTSLLIDGLIDVADDSDASNSQCIGDFRSGSVPRHSTSMRCASCCAAIRPPERWVRPGYSFFLVATCSAYLFTVVEEYSQAT